MTTHTKAREEMLREFTEEATKYFAWVDSSGIHGKEKYKAYTDFLSKTLPSAFAKARTDLIAELVGKVGEEMEKREGEYKNASDWVNSAKIRNADDGEFTVACETLEREKGALVALDRAIEIIESMK